MNFTRRQIVSRAGALAVTLALIPAGANPAGETVPHSRTFRLVYEAVVHDVPESASRAVLWLPYPPDTEYQILRDVSIHSDLPHEIITEPKHGNRAVRFMMPPGMKETKVSLEFVVTRIERRHWLGDQHPGSRGAAPVAAAEGGKEQSPAIWLKPDRRVPVDDTIRRWAEETAAGETTTIGKARAVFDYIVDNIRYDKSGTGWGNGDIYWACDAKRGNCTDFHAIFIGYVRALGIPARFQIGFPLPGDRGSGEIGGYHCWAEFYAEGEGWIPVDASEAHKRPEMREYFFGAHDENRVLLTVGRDLVLPDMEDDPLNFFVYPYAEVDGHAFDGVERRFSYRDVTADVARAAGPRVLEGSPE